MTEEQTLTGMITLAQQGHIDSVSQLARQAKPRVYAFIYRVTLDHDLSEDLSQEALLAMVKHLNRFKKPETFWPWLYRIAQNKIQDHYREKQRKQAPLSSALYEDFLSQRTDYRQDDGLRRLVTKELSRKVITAMKQLNRQYRAVLSLRCFDQLSYAEIAVAMECSEVRARVLFFRAKQELKKKLSHSGVKKGLLLMCLGLFGRLTAPAEAASSTVTVAVASTKVGLTTALIAAATTKLGIIAAAVVVVGLASRGVFFVLSEPHLPERGEVTSFHYTTQSRNNSPGAVSSLSKGAFEQWFYFPEGIDGPMFMRMQRWDPQQENKLCSWLQNGQANYYYHCGENRVYINNYRIWRSSLDVRRLPTDTPEFTSFLSEVEGATDQVTYRTDPATGLFLSAVDNRFVDAPNFRTTYGYNTLNEGEFAYDWADDVPIIDGRDRMHTRGWTYFRISGTIDGQIVVGRGQVPFVYDASKEHPVWMTLNIAHDIEIIDCSNGASLRRADGTLIAVYPSGTFFAGLVRPWMGMHAVDTVRRDAAAQRVWFKTVAENNAEDVIVTLTYGQDNAGAGLVYTIDLENDIIKDLRFDVGNRAKGSLTFSYLQDIDDVGDEFVEPALSHDSQLPVLRSPGMLWLIYLAQGTLDHQPAGS